MLKTKSTKESPSWLSAIPETGQLQFGNKLWIKKLLQVWIGWQMKFSLIFIFSIKAPSRKCYDAVPVTQSVVMQELQYSQHHQEMCSVVNHCCLNQTKLHCTNSLFSWQKKSGGQLWHTDAEIWDQS